MTKRKEKSELDQQDKTSVPTYQESWNSEVGTRIKEAATLIGTRETAAKIAGIDTETLSRWFKGISKASFLGVARLCLAAGKSLDWLATGIEPADHSTSYAVDALDEEALARALEVVEEVGAGVPLGKRARLLKLAYTLYIRSGSALDQPSLKALVKEALSQTM